MRKQKMLGIVLCLGLLLTVSIAGEGEMAQRTNRSPFRYVIVSHEVHR
jgi:hypothetical protein